MGCIGCCTTGEKARCDFPQDMLNATPMFRCKPRKKKGWKKYVVLLLRIAYLWMRRVGETLPHADHGVV
jgi:hypothetical protein